MNTGLSVKPAKLVQVNRSFRCRLALLRNGKARNDWRCRYLFIQSEIVHAVFAVNLPARPPEFCLYEACSAFTRVATRQLAHHLSGFHPFQLNIRRRGPLRSSPDATRSRSPHSGRVWRGVAASPKSRGKIDTTKHLCLPCVRPSNRCSSEISFHHYGPAI